MPRVAKKKAEKKKKSSSITPSANGDVSSEIAFTKIKQMMYQNVLKPGQKIIYQELAKKLNLSITPIVHALGREILLLS